jgi:hypothetical protein
MIFLFGQFILKAGTNTGTNKGYGDATILHLKATQKV